MKPSHPVAELFPLLEGSELNALIEDIRQNGLREPITLHPDGSILDGRNRYRACLKAEIEPRFDEWDGQGTVEAFVVSKNLHRRHLNESQRQMIAARLANISRGGVGRNRTANLQTKVSEAAELLNVGERGVYHAKTILKHGAPEEIAAVDRGETAASGTAKKIQHRRKQDDEAVHPKSLRQKRTTGPRVAVPDGMTAEDYCRKGMETMSYGKTVEEAANQLRLGSQTFRMMRDIVLLADNENLSARDRDTVTAALADMNKTRQVRPNHERIRSIAEKVWGTKRRERERAEIGRIKDFQKAYGFLVDTCSHAEGIEIPYLAEDMAKECAAELKRAEDSVRALRHRVMEYSNV